MNRNSNNKKNSKNGKIRRAFVYIQYYFVKTATKKEHCVCISVRWTKNCVKELGNFFLHNILRTLDSHTAAREEPPFIHAKTISDGH